jgi:hypothetical protein
MVRPVRFIVHERIGRDVRRLGLFTAAYHVRDERELAPHDRPRFDELLAWFECELTIPPHATMPAPAIFWYSNARPFARRMWELGELLIEYGYNTELITGRSLGLVVYRDEHQVAAVPHRRRR